MWGTDSMDSYFIAKRDYILKGWVLWNPLEFQMNDSRIDWNNNQAVFKMI